MVRTKCSPIPFGNSSNNTLFRLGNEPIGNTFKCSTLNYPTRVKLKGKRKLTKSPNPIELYSGAKRANKISQLSCSSQSGQNYAYTRANNGHKRQKSLHRILTKLIVNINNKFRVYYIYRRRMKNVISI